MCGPLLLVSSANNPSKRLADRPCGTLGRSCMSLSEELALASRTPLDTKKTGITPFLLMRCGVIPNVVQLASYLARFRLGVKRGMMNSCAMAANTRAPSLTLNANIRSPLPRFELG